MQAKQIAIVADHAGFELKQTLAAYLKVKGYDVMDLGPDTDENAIDYPDQAQKLADWMQTHPGLLSVAICGSGEGICMALNRFSFIRAGLVYDLETAEMTRRHNNANVICFGGRIADPDFTKQALDIFLATPFEGGRHQRRIDKLEGLGHDM